MQISVWSFSMVDRNLKVALWVKVPLGPKKAILKIINPPKN